MTTKDYNRFYKVFTILQLVANNGGIASLDHTEAQAVVEAIEDLHAAGAAAIEIYDTHPVTQQVGGQPLEHVIEKLARIIDCTGGESR